MKKAEGWLQTFSGVFSAEDRKSVLSAIEAIIKQTRIDALAEAAAIAASHEIEDSDKDVVAREIAREIIRAEKIGD